MTELATEVMVSEVIQREKWVARMSPMSVIRMRLFFGSVLSSCCLFLFKRMNGSKMRVVKRRR